MKFKFFLSLLLNFLFCRNFSQLGYPHSAGKICLKDFSVADGLTYRMYRSGLHRIPDPVWSSGLGKSILVMAEKNIKYRKYFSMVEKPR